MDNFLTESDALLVVDVQNDFLSGGSLAVPKSNTILPVINDYLELFQRNGLPVFASRDYHPEDHVSFSTRQGPWPPHCVAGTPGAEFHIDLNLPENCVIISKATSSEKDAYSALDSTGLGKKLQLLGIKRVFVCGLATDYCVHASAKDLLKEGFDVIILIDAIQAVNVTPGDGDKALDDLKSLGAIEISLKDIDR